MIKRQGDLDLGWDIDEQVQGRWSSTDASSCLDRFVGDEEAGADDQRPSDRDGARRCRTKQAARVAILEVVPQADLSEHLGRPAGGPFAAQSRQAVVDERGPAT